MALPVVNTPKYELTLPGSGKKITYRPFLVKEEKILMMASESEDPKAMNIAISQIVDSCVDGGLKIDDLPTFDVEYLFIQLRSNSVGESVDVKMTCPKCSAEITKRIDLSTAKVVQKEDIDLKVPITNEIGIMMKYPTFGDVKDIDGKKNPMEFINCCIDYIYDSNQIYKKSDCTKKELDDFVDSLSHAQILKMQEFFENMPRIEKDVSFKCDRCDNKVKQTVSGMASFFG